MRQTAFLDRLIGRDYLNYRTLFLTQYTRDNDVILFRELATVSRRKHPFGYFESGNRYLNLWNSTAKAGNGFRRKNLRNITYKEYENARPVLELLGVKYVLAFDALTLPGLSLVEKSVSSFAGHTSRLVPSEARQHMLALCARYLSNFRCQGYDRAMRKYLSRTLYVYELERARGIAFAARGVQVYPRPEVLTRLFKEKETPWLEGKVYLERAPRLARQTQPNGESPQGVTTVSILAEDGGGVELAVEGTAPAVVVLTMPFVGWGQTAYVDNEKTDVLRAYGGFSAVEVPAGSHRVTMRYRPYDIYLGILLALFTLLGAWYFSYGRSRQSDEGRWARVSAFLGKIAAGWRPRR